MSSLKEKQYIDVLQIFRGIAALMVIVHHSYGSFTHYHHVSDNGLQFLASIGKYGVDFFFVLSGFIISHTSYYKEGEKAYIKTYLIKRLLRIYVPYLPIGVTLLILYFLFPQISSVNRNISVLSSLTLIPYGNPALSVAWTLMHELLFYFLFVLFFFSKNRWAAFAVFWFISILFYNYYLKTFLTISNPFLNIFFSNYNIEFILGYFLAAALKEGFKINRLVCHSLFLFFILCFIVLKYLKIEFFSFSTNFIFSVGCFFLFFYHVQKNRQINKKNVFMMIGNATYSIYLIHNPLQAILVRFLPDGSANNLILYIEVIFVLIVCSIAGYLYYLLFEKLILSKMNKLLLR